MPLSALDLPKESGIIISALAPLWQYQSIKKLGYMPVIVDVDPASGLVYEPDGRGRDKERRPACCCCMNPSASFPIWPLLLALNIPVIEDISQSAGAVVAEKQAGQYGVFAILGLEERDHLTGGGGAVLIAAARREAIVLKKLADEAPATDILPDINSALAYVQLKEQPRNTLLRKDIHTLYVRSPDAEPPQGR